MKLTKRELDKLKPEKSELNNTSGKGKWSKQPKTARGYTTRKLASGKIRYISQGKVDGKTKEIGRFWTPEEATKAYKEAVINK